MKRSLILTIAVLICVFGFSNVSLGQEEDFGQDEDFWITNFEYLETGMNATGTRSYVIFYYLEIRREKGKITAIYQSGENSSLYKKMLLTVEMDGNTARFYYDHCLENEEWDVEPCKDHEKKGDLMFKLVKSIGTNGKTVILTYGMKNKSFPKGEVFFKKAEIPKQTPSDGQTSGHSTETPEDRVRSFYKWVIGTMIKKQEPVRQKKAVSTYLSKSLYRWLYMTADAETRSYYLLPGNDWIEAWIDQIKIADTKVKAKRAAVRVDIGLDGSDDNFLNPVRVNLIKESGTWKIDCIQGIDEEFEIPEYDPKYDPPGCKQV